MASALSSQLRMAASLGSSSTPPSSRIPSRPCAPSKRASIQALHRRHSLETDSQLAEAYLARAGDPQAPPTYVADILGVEHLDLVEEPLGHAEELDEAETAHAIAITSRS